MDTILDDAFNLTEATVSRCLNSVAISILLYDQLLSVDDEVEYIWKAKMSGAKILFLAVRYLMPSALFVNAYQQSYSNVTLPQLFCKVWFNIAASIFILVTGVENFLVLLRVWTLYNRNRAVMKWTSLFYVLIQTSTAGWTIAIMARTTEHFNFIGDRGSHNFLCSTTNRSLLPAMYIPTVTFEAVMLLLILGITYRRSKNANGTGDGLWHYLLHDGFIYVLLLFLFRVANLIITATAPAPLIFASLCFGCATSAATVSRLILNIRKESVIQRRRAMMPYGTTTEDMETDMDLDERSLAFSGQGAVGHVEHGIGRGHGYNYQLDLERERKVRFESGELEYELEAPEVEVVGSDKNVKKYTGKSKG